MERSLFGMVWVLFFGCWLVFVDGWNHLIWEAFGHSTPLKIIYMLWFFQILSRIMERIGEKLVIVGDGLGLVIFVVDWFLLTDEIIWGVFGYSTPLKIISYAVVFQVLPRIMERSLFGMVLVWLSLVLIGFCWWMKLFERCSGTTPPRNNFKCCGFSGFAQDDGETLVWDGLGLMTFVFDWFCWRVISFERCLGTQPSK